MSIIGHIHIGTLDHVSTWSNGIDTNVMVPDGVIVAARGQQADKIRYLYDRYPNMPQSAIARRVGCGQDHVSHVIKRYVKSITTDELAEFQANKADIFDALQHRALISLSDDHMAKASALQLVTMAAILEDKSRLVRGQATSINVNALLDVAEVMRQQRG